MNGTFIWYIRILALDYFVSFRFVTMHAFDRQRDRQTDGQTERRQQYRAYAYVIAW